MSKFRWGGEDIDDLPRDEMRAALEWVCNMAAERGMIVNAEIKIEGEQLDEAALEDIVKRMGDEFQKRMGLTPEQLGVKTSDEKIPGFLLRPRAPAAPAFRPGIIIGSSRAWWWLELAAKLRLARRNPSSTDYYDATVMESISFWRRTFLFEFPAPPPQHPNCRCVVIGEDETGELFQGRGPEQTFTPADYSLVGDKELKSLGIGCQRKGDRRRDIDADARLAAIARHGARRQGDRRRT